MKYVRIFRRFRCYLLHHGYEFVQSLQRFGLGRLDHQGLMEQQGEVYGRSMESIVEQPLCYVERGRAGFAFARTVVDQAVEYELMFADRGYGELVAILQRFFDVVR